MDLLQIGLTTFHAVHEHRRPTCLRCARTHLCIEAFRVQQQAIHIKQNCGTDLRQQNSYLIRCGAHDQEKAYV